MSVVAPPVSSEAPPITDVSDVTSFAETTNVAYFLPAPLKVKAVAEPGFVPRKEGRWRPRMLEAQFDSGMGRGYLKVIKMDGTVRHNIALEDILNVSKYLIQPQYPAEFHPWDPDKAAKSTRSRAANLVAKVKKTKREKSNLVHQLGNNANVEGEDAEIPDDVSAESMADVDDEELPDYKEFISGAIGLKLETSDGRFFCFATRTYGDRDMWSDKLRGAICLHERRLTFDQPNSLRTSEGVHLGSKPDPSEFIDFFLNASNYSHEHNVLLSKPPAPTVKLSNREEELEKWTVVPDFEKDGVTNTGKIFFRREASTLVGAIKNRMPEEWLNSIYGQAVNLRECEVTITKPWTPWLNLEIRVDDRRRRRLEISCDTFDMRIKWEEWFVALGAKKTKSLEDQQEEKRTANSDGLRGWTPGSREGSGSPHATTLSDGGSDSEGSNEPIPTGAQSFQRRKSRRRGSSAVSIRDRPTNSEDQSVISPPEPELESEFSRNGALEPRQEQEHEERFALEDHSEESNKKSQQQRWGTSNEFVAPTAVRDESTSRASRAELPKPVPLLKTEEEESTATMESSSTNVSFTPRVAFEVSSFEASSAPRTRADSPKRDVNISGFTELSSSHTDESKMTFSQRARHQQRQRQLAPAYSEQQDKGQQPQHQSPWKQDVVPLRSAMEAPETQWHTSSGATDSIQNFKFDSNERVPMNLATPPTSTVPPPAESTSPGSPSMRDPNFWMRSQPADAPAPSSGRTSPSRRPPGPSTTENPSLAAANSSAFSRMESFDFSFLGRQESGAAAPPAAPAPSAAQKGANPLMETVPAASNPNQNLQRLGSTKEVAADPATPGAAPSRTRSLLQRVCEKDASMRKTVSQVMGAGNSKAAESAAGFSGMTVDSTASPKKPPTVPEHLRGKYFCALCKLDKALFAVCETTGHPHVLPVPVVDEDDDDCL